MNSAAEPKSSLLSRAPGLHVIRIMSQPEQKIRGAVIVACVLLVTMAIVFRAFADRVQHVPLVLSEPLSEFPLEIVDWSGTDEPISEQLLAVAGNDDYLHRYYRHAGQSGWVNLYIAFTGTPGKLLGHRPEVCYVAAGYVQQDNQPGTFKTSGGRDVAFTMNEFYRPGKGSPPIHVMHYYLLDDQLIVHERGFSGLKFRKPNLNRDKGRYAAQVRFSGPDPELVQQAAADLSDQIIAFFLNNK